MSCFNRSFFKTQIWLKVKGRIISDFFKFWSLWHILGNGQGEKLWYYATFNLWSILCKNFYWKFSKIADVCDQETPPPLESANVCNLDHPPPLKIADVLCGRPPRNIKKSTNCSLYNGVMCLKKSHTVDYKPGAYASGVNRSK